MPAGGDGKWEHSRPPKDYILSSCMQTYFTLGDYQTGEISFLGSWTSSGKPDGVERNIFLVPREDIFPSFHFFFQLKTFRHIKPEL